ncbi:MAG: endonuclease/exonuclease/phosphatase family protein, partial [Chloroflexota bacterium]|nr:endonuclease/exonuclease/phosphatase family protein [Chloroflexota bacterium]
TLGPPANVGDQAMHSTLTPRQSDATSVRTLTHNIFGHHGPWDRRRPILIDGIQALNPDLMTFQETIVTEGYDQVADIIGSDYHVVHSRERDPDGMGVSIASRWPIASVNELDLSISPRTSGFPCTTLIAEIEAPSPIGTLLLVNHFPDYQPGHEYEREVQTLTAAQYIEHRVAERDTHVIFAGDLDAAPDAASMRFLSGKQSLGAMSVCYRNAWERVHGDEPGHTYTRENGLVAAGTPDWPFQRIDHIFVRCGRNWWPTLLIEDCQLAFDRPVDDMWASDHYALVADLVVAETGDR